MSAEISKERKIVRTVARNKGNVLIFISIFNGLLSYIGILFEILYNIFSATASAPPFIFAITTKKLRAAV